MSIEKVNGTYQRGLVIIVGNKPDGILIHAANALGEEIQFLDMSHITIYDELIYLIGHGDLKKRTIDGIQMKEIAEKLCKNGYNGRQKLYVMACDTKTMYHGTTMYDLLCYYLYHLGISKDDIKNNVKCDFDGKSVIIGDCKNAELWNIKDRGWQLYRQKRKQSIFIKTKGYYINVSLFVNEKKLSNINGFKKRIIRAYGGIDMSCSEQTGEWWYYYAIFGGLLVGGLFLMLLGGFRITEILLDNLTLEFWIALGIIIISSLGSLFTTFCLKIDRLQRIFYVLLGTGIILCILYFFIITFMTKYSVASISLGTFELIGGFLIALIDAIFLICV